MRHHHRRRHGEVRPARDSARRDAGRGRHAAPAARGVEGQGDGHVPDRALHGGGGGRAGRAGVARGAGGVAARRCPGRGRDDLRVLPAGRDDGEGVGESCVRNDAGGRRDVRAAPVPFDVRHRGPEGGNGGVRGEAQAGVQASLSASGDEWIVSFLPVSFCDQRLAMKGAARAAPFMHILCENACRKAMGCLESRLFRANGNAVRKRKQGWMG
ncbi:hypothetical protein BGLA2_740001 [Burkholderia gladioli]|nr:hypothetical protein BGLA2_740001 [Burkholderia gladioli]